ncbi:MAG: hypothetical protein ACR2RV_02750, partial [Verrucomicrobiales bacterium]
MPLTESDEEILFHQPANVNETPDRADPQRQNTPPTKRVVRPSAEAKLSDVIRHQPPPERPAAREVPKTQQPAAANVPAAPASTKA